MIFDLDGTLLDTVTDIAHAANRALERHGFPAHGLETVKSFVGNGARKLMERALPEDHRDDPTVDRLNQAFSEAYARQLTAHTRPYEGIEAMLDAVAAAGIPMAILSNKPHPLTLGCVEALLSRWSFDPVLGQRPGFPKKPDPTVPAALARHFGLPPADVALVGDTAADMGAAVNSGMLPVGVLWGFRGRDELESSGARVIVEQAVDLAPVLLDPGR